MRKTITGMATIAILGMLFLTSFPPASAAKPVPTTIEQVSTGFTDVVCVDVSARERHCTYVLISEFQGDWVGLWTCPGHVTFRLDDPGHARVASWHCAGSFEGTILGRSGTVQLSAQQLSKAEMIDGQQNLVWLHYQNNIGQGTDGLEDIHGECTTRTDTSSATPLTTCWVHFE